MENLSITGEYIDFDSARDAALALVSVEIAEPMLISWCDRERNIHSPSCLKCEIKGKPGWDVYGLNHGGRFRVNINNEQYIFIYG
jgi:hypothetical protein